MSLGKILWELIEPCSKRIAELKDFAEDVDPFLTYYIVPISDLYGPTKEDPNMDMIVVSEETEKGGKLVNEKRKENNLRLLDIHVVKLLEDSNHREHEEAKISSSNHRIRLLGKRLKKPVSIKYSIKRSIFLFIPVIQYIIFIWPLLGKIKLLFCRVLKENH